MNSMTQHEDEIALWCQSYVEAFSAFDAKAIAAHWDYPASVLQAGRLFSFPDQESFAKNVNKLCGFYRRQNVVSAVRTLSEFFVLSGGVVSIRVEDQMLSVTGRKIISWPAAYTLRKTKDGWRAIFAVADGETQAWAALGTPLGS